MTEIECKKERRLDGGHGSRTARLDDGVDDDEADEPSCQIRTN